MTGDPPAADPPRPPVAAQPCGESCAAYRPFHPDRWADYGRCMNPRSRYHGYPVHPGRECRHFLPSTGSGALNRAN